MNVGYAYMGIAALLILFGALMGVRGIDPYGDILLVISILLIYLGSTRIADARDDGEAANHDVE